MAQGRCKSRLPSKLVEGTNTVFFFFKQAIPKDKKITYANFVCDVKLYNTETHRVFLTVEGDQLMYDGNPRSLAISLLDLKIHINFFISEAHKGTHYMTADIINYDLNNPMSNFQYMQIHLKDIPH